MIKIKKGKLLKVLDLQVNSNKDNKKKINMSIKKQSETNTLYFIKKQ